VRLLDLGDRGDRLFVGFLASMAVVTGILGWQALESQEVKSALQGGFEGPVSFEPLREGEGGGGALYVNAGDRTLTLEGAELIEPTENFELIEVAAREPGALEPQELEDFELAPGAEVEIVTLFRVTGPGEAGFEGVRVYYRAGGRAGQTP
jgi:hypothetical protein